MNTNILSESKIGLLDKRLLASRIACLFFILFNIYWFFDTINQPFLNFIAISGIIVFSTQFIFQFKPVNGILGGLSFLLCFYMMLAVFDEFTDFVVATSEAYTLLIVGLILSLLGMAGSFLMLRSLIIN